MTYRPFFDSPTAKAWVLVVCVLWSSAAQAGPTEPISAEQEALAQIRLLEQNRRQEMSVWRPHLRSQSRSIRLAAVRAVGQSRVEKALPILREIATNGTDLELQDAALFSLALVGELEDTHLIDAVGAANQAEVKARRVRLIGLLPSAGLVSTELKNLVNNLIMSKEPRVLTALLNALRQRAMLEPNGGLLVTSSRIAELISQWSADIQFIALHLIDEQKDQDESWKSAISAFCQKADRVELKNRCLSLRSSLGAHAEGIVIPTAKETEWRTQMAVARAYASGNQSEALSMRIRAHLPGLKEGSIALETPLFYGVITPISLAIAMPAGEELHTVAKDTYQAIQLEGLSVEGVTGGLGLGLSHVHCAAAALADRNKERVRLTKKCGAKDYNQSLRHMWMVRAVMHWQPKKRAAWFKRRYDKIEPRAQILALALAEETDKELLSALIARALKSQVGAVAGSAAELVGRQGIKGLEGELVSVYRRTIAQREFSVVEAVITALAKLSYETAEDLFSRHREDPHSGIRQAALLGLKAIEQRRLRENHIDRLETMQLAKRRFEPPPAAALERKSIDRGLITPPIATEFIARTTKGDFSLALQPDWAFFGAKKLVRLASQGFFNGQGITLKRGDDIMVGDPSGLGWEGKGRNVPDEMTPVEVGSGYLILDRSGRDTATSRLLITRRARPDLFGRVNVVGKILSGTENLAAVVEGDRILNIKPRVTTRTK